MSIESVLSKVIFKSAGNSSTHAWGSGMRVESLDVAEWQMELVNNWIVTLYRSPAAIAKLEELTQGEGVILISAAILAGSGGGVAYANGHEIQIDFNDIVSTQYFNRLGEVVIGRGELFLAHELIHLSSESFPNGQYDPVSFSNDGQFNSAAATWTVDQFDGPAVAFQNLVSRELADAGESGFGVEAERVGYQMAWRSSDSEATSQFPLGSEWTDGLDIDIVHKGASIVQFGLENADNSLSTANRTDKSRDLLFGLNGNDTISSGGGNDHLWGGDGNDTLDSGDDDDIVHGEAGEDAIIGGKGNDVIDGGHSGGFLGLPTDLQQDTLTYDALGGSVTFRLQGANSNSSRVGNVVVQKLGDGGASDTVSEVEKFIGTSSADTLLIDAATEFSAFTTTSLDLRRPGVLFDLAGQGATPGVADTIDAKSFGQGLRFDLRNISGQSVEIIGTSDQIKVAGAEGVYGTNHDDEILGATGGGNALIGGGGSDTIKGGSGADRLVGGFKNGESYEDDGAVDTITSGGGNDLIYFSSQDRLTDRASAGAKLYYADGSPRAQMQLASRALFPVGGTEGPARLLVGGEEKAPPTNPCNPSDASSDDASDGVYESADGTKYTLANGALTIEVNGNTVYLDSFRNGDGGIRLKEARPDQDQAECNRDPLIIDLDGDRNVVRELFDSTAYFDLDNDGFRERVAWSLSGDGFLVRDRNGNGQIDDGTELFGSGRTEFDGGVAAQKGTSGFAELTTLDSNFDGTISSLDAEYATLRVWMDANGDAITDEGELKTLGELGIVSISLSTFKSDDLDCGCDGTEVTYRSNVTFADGSLRSMYDAYLSLDQYDTREIVNDVQVPSDFADLPFLIGSGTLSDLDVAMARDPALEEMVRAFAALTPEQAGEIGSRAEQILLRWTGADAVPADSRGTSINGRWLHAIEKVSGSDFNQARIGANPRSDAASILITEYTRLLGDVSAKLLGQTSLGQTVLSGLSYEGAAFYTAETGATATSILANAVLSEPTGESAKLTYWHTVATSLQRYTNALGMTAAQMDAAINQVLLQQGVGLTVTELSNALFASSANGGQVVDSIQSSVGGKTYAINRVLVATQGDARLNGGAGSDHYIVTDTAGSVSIVDLDGTDKLDLRGWNRALTTATTRELQSEFDATAGTFTASYELTLAQGASSVQINVEFRNGELLADVENVSFEDGSFDIADLMDFGGKVVVGGTGAGWEFAPSASSQFLLGRGTSNVYRLSASSGTDIISQRRFLTPTNDVVKIDALPSEVVFASGGNDLSNLIVKIVGTSGALTIAGHFSDSGRSIETFEFSDGSRMSAAEVQAALTTGTTGSDVLQGTAANDLFDGMGGDDVLSGGKGEDSYLFRPGYGQLVVDDLNGTNRIRIEGAVTASDLDFSIQNDGLRIAVGGQSDVVLVRGNNAAMDTQIELNGSIVDVASQLVEKARLAGTAVNGRIDGTAGDDNITGSSDADLIAGNGGSDFVQGGLGNDTFLVSSGKVRLSDTGFGFDRILVDSAFSINDFKFVTAGSSSNALRIRLGGTDLRVDLPNRVNSSTGLAQTSASDIEEIAFSDGRVINLTAGRAISGGSADDVLFNFGTTATTFTPGAGNDYIFSLNGNHGLQLNAGFGHDVFHSNTAGNITFTGISLDNHVSFAREGLDLIVRVADGADTLTLKNAFEPLATFRNRTLFFTGSQITVQQIVNSIALKTDGDDTLWGRAALDGGAGNDVLIGDGAANTYVFGRGYGNDVIKEQDGIFGNSGAPDVLTLSGLNRGDVTFARDAADPLSIVITIRDTGETLTLDGTPFDDFVYNAEDTLGDGYSVGDQSGAHWIDQIVFADGTVLSQREIEQEIIDAESTSGADLLTNFGAPSGSFIGLPGASLDGGAGNDTYINQFDDVFVRLSTGSDSDRLVNLNPGRTRVHVSLDGIAAEDILVLFEQRDGQNVTVLRARSGEQLVIDGRPISNTDLTIYITDSANGSTYTAFAEGALVDGQIATSGVDFLNGTITDTGGEIGFIFPNDDVFTPGKGDDVIAGRGGADTIVFNAGDGNDRLLRSGLSSGGFGGIPENYTLQLGSGLLRQDFTYNWLNDGTYNVLLSFNDQGDGVTIDARQALTISYADGSVIELGAFGNSSLILSPGQAVWFNDASDDTFIADFGSVQISVGANSGHDRFTDNSLSSGTTLLQPPPGWQSSSVILVGGTSLDDFEFVRDSSAPDNLVVRNLLTGSSIVIEGQFASEALIGGLSSWQSPDLDGDGVADWAALDLDSDGVAEFAKLDSDGDGNPNWSNPDFDGDGIIDWQHRTVLTLDTNGDGETDVRAFDENADGVVDTFDVQLTPTATQPSVYGVTFRDTDGDNIVDEYTTDYVTFTPFPTDGNGAVAWGTIDTNEDGIADVGSLDIDGDGAPNWLSTDLDGDGQSDWADASFDELNDADGNYVGLRVFDQQSGNATYVVDGSFGGIVARDTNGDGEPDEVGLDRDYDLHADALEAFYPVSQIGLLVQSPDGSSTTTFSNWDEIAARVITRDEGTESSQFTTLDLLANRPAATSGNDTLVVGSGETVDGLGGDDAIHASDGGATIRFGRGSGNDTVFSDRPETSSANTVEFTNIQSPNDIEVLRGAGDSADLVIRIRDTGEELRIVGQWQPSSNGTTFAMVQNFSFANGEQFSQAQMLTLVTGNSGVGGSIVTTGSDGGLLDGGAGNDTLAGGTGNDVYEFGRGFDEDVIRDAGGTDTVNFAEGIAFADLYFSRVGLDGGNLLIEVSGLDRLSLTIAGQFVPGAARVENFQFADGRTFTWSDIEAIILDQNQTGGNDTILGFSGNDVLRGLAGNDTITGTWGDDVIYGGAGRDTAVYRGVAADYDISTVNGVTTVTDRIAGRDGTDTLNGIEELRFTGSGGSTILLSPANGAPVTAGTSVSGLEDSDIVINRSDLLALASDADGDGLQLTVGGASHGKVWIGLDGNIRFRPEADFNGEASFDYSVTDGNGGAATARVTVSIDPTNDAPAVSTGFADVAVFEDQPVIITIPATIFSDVDGDAVTMSVRRAGGDPLPAWLSFAGGVLSGTPPLDFNGALDLEITGSDETLSTGVPFKLSVLALNDAPRIVAPIGNLAVARGSAVSIAIPASNFEDPEDDPTELTVTLANGEPLPSWLTYINGVLQGTLPSNQVDSIVLAVRASDGRAVTTSQFAINVTSNVAPAVGSTLADVTSPEDGPVLIALPENAFSDSDGDQLTLSASLADGSPLPEWLTFDGSKFAGQPPANFNGAFELKVTANDGTQTASQIFQLTISPVNDAPVLLQPLGNLSIAEDEPFSMALPSGVFSDVDSETLTLSARQADGSQLPAWLSFDAENAIFSGTPSNANVGSLQLTITAADSVGAIATTNFTLSVTNVNDAPVLNGSLVDRTTAENTAFSMVLPATLFADADVGDTLSINVTSADGSQLPGWLHFDPTTRTLFGTPLNENVGTSGVRVTATDQAGASATGSFALTVTNVNDAPVVDLGLANVAIAEDTPFNFVVPTHAFKDVDGDVLQLSASLDDGAALPSWLTFDGARFSGTPPLNFNGAYPIKVTANDGQATVTTNFTLSFTPVNDAPVASNNALYNVASGGQATITLADLLANDVDVDGDMLTLASFGTPGHGTAALDAQGSIVYTPNAGYSGADSMTYTITDGQATSTATIAITVVNPDPYAGWQQGTAGNDFIFGNLFTTNRIFGAAGNDLITGGTANDSLAGGSGNDILFGLGGDDIIEGNDGVDALSGGSGNDQLTGGAGNDILTGDSGIDTAVFAGAKSSYSIQTFFGVVTIADNAPSVDGNDGTDTLIGVEKAIFKNGEQLALAAPVVLDLDGDGVELVSRTGFGRRQTTFDWDNDGRRDRTGWVGRDDGFLVYDRNGDGTVTNASELSFTSDKDGAKSDLDGLTAFDSNGDGILSAQDEKFTSFHVWQDRNSDGKVGRGEFMTLQQAGIASLTLAGEAVNQTWAWDQNIVINNGTYTRTDGSTRQLADVALNYAVPRATGVAPLSIPNDVLAMDEGTSSATAIRRSASQLVEAIAGLRASRGTGEIYGNESWMDKREMMLAAHNRFDMR